MAISYTLLIMTTISNLAVLQIFVSNLLAGSWIHEFFYDLGCFITVLVDLCFLCYCFLISVFDDGLLTYGFAHSTTHAASKTA